MTNSKLTIKAFCTIMKDETTGRMLFMIDPSVKQQNEIVEIFLEDESKMLHLLPCELVIDTSAATNSLQRKMRNNILAALNKSIRDWSREAGMTVAEFKNGIAQKWGPDYNLTAEEFSFKKLTTEELYELNHKINDWCLPQLE